MHTDLVKELDPDKLNVLCDILVKRVSDYFKDEEHRKSFEEWYRQKYGEEYVWR